MINYDETLSELNKAILSLAKVRTELMELVEDQNKEISSMAKDYEKISELNNKLGDILYDRKQTKQ